MLKNWIYLLLAVCVTVLLSTSVLAESTGGKDADKAGKVIAVKRDGLIHIYTCGTGAPIISHELVRRPSCLLMIANGELYQFDVGEGSDQLLASLHMPLNKIKTVFISHWHSDHFSGLGSLMNQGWLEGRQKRLQVYGPYGVDQVVQGINQAYQFDALFRSIQAMHDLEPSYAFATPHTIVSNMQGTTVFEKNGAVIRSFTVDHIPVIPALGYILQYKHCKVVYSGDTTVTNSLARASSHASLLISEATMHTSHSKEFIKKHSIMKLYIYHADALDVAKMAEKARVGTLVLTHLAPALSNSVEDKAKFIVGLDQYYHNKIFVASDGDEWTLKPTDKGCVVNYHPYLHNASRTT